MKCCKAIRDSDDFKNDTYAFFNRDALLMLLGEVYDPKLIKGKSGLFKTSVGF